MQLHGQNFIGGRLSSEGPKTFQGYDPREGKTLEPPFHQATESEIEAAVQSAASAFREFRSVDAGTLISLLSEIADDLSAQQDEIAAMAQFESGLPRERLIGEVARTANQLRMFAQLVKEGSYVDARIDTALPDRKPLPRPDLRRMLIPVGPVVVFAASNFPLAFSVAGGDTASAFAARNPVIVKAHPAHPGTSELVAAVIVGAVKKVGLPAGIFSMVHAVDPAISLALVRHPLACAVAFTGSEHAGRAIFDAAAQRPEPIPAFVEMGSVNPVFILPGASRQSADSIVQGLFNSINLGVGQFCTNPGLVVGGEPASFGALIGKLSALFQQASPGSMLYPRILAGYDDAVKRAAAVDGVQATRSTKAAEPDKTEARPVLFETDAMTFLGNRALASEIFGPSSIAIRCESEDELSKVARSMPGTLTATIFGTPDDLQEHRELIAILQTKAGRLIFNGFPTGVEVSSAMHHGGPYPATADAKFTSVGTAAILRFLRPVCYQNFPQSVLPDELKDDNPRAIWRTVNGQLSRDSVSASKGA